MANIGRMLPDEGLVEDNILTDLNLFYHQTKVRDLLEFSAYLGSGLITLTHCDIQWSVSDIFYCIRLGFRLTPGLCCASKPTCAK